MFHSKGRKEEGCTCYVLITCSEAGEQGEMKVAMEFEGDESLAAYLVNNASQVFEQKLAARCVD